MASNGATPYIVREPYLNDKLSPMREVTLYVDHVQRASLPNQYASRRSNREDKNKHTHETLFLQTEVHVHFYVSSVLKEQENRDVKHTEQKKQGCSAAIDVKKSGSERHQKGFSKLPRCGAKVFSKM